MATGIYVALSGAVAQEKLLESTAENLSNASTHGYQRMRPVFKEVLAKAGPKGAAKPGPYHLANVDGTVLDASEGAVEKTGNKLDVALPKDTYLAVETKAGERYTRAGSLKVGKGGFLETQSGLRVLGEGGKPIKIGGEGDVALGANGGVAVDGDTVGRLRLVTFAKPAALVHEGGSLLSAPAAAGPATVAADPVLEVGALEQSNSPVVHAMTDLVTAQRSFDAFQRAIDAFREADRKVVTTVPSAT